jgi:diguanylate cyclase (GGDEF)-like protein/PAS domain S-box-containing protein
MATGRKTAAHARQRAGNSLCREAILEAVGFAAGCFLRSGSWQECIPRVLERFGQAADASGVYIFENHSGPNNILQTGLRSHWLAPGIVLHHDRSAFDRFSLTAAGIGSWLDALKREQPIHGSIDKFPERARSVLAVEGIKSFVLVPVFDRDVLWGFMGLDDRRRERDWTAPEIEALRAAASILGAAVSNERIGAGLATSESEVRFRRLFENLLESVFQIVPDGRIISANPAMVRLLGYASEAELLAVNAADTYANREDRVTWLERMGQEGELRNFETTLKRKDGSLVPVLLNSRAIREASGETQYFEGTITDITDRKRLESQLILMANRDPLTNLFNRRRFQEELELQLNQSKRYGMQSALLWLDVDRFKEVNDTMGHRCGDELLMALARLLEGQLRGHDVLARLGGDEFAILMPYMDALQAHSVAARLLEAVHENTFEIGGHPLRITVSIGIALYPEHATSADKLLVHADLAMYRAKEEGRNRFSFCKLEEDRSERLGISVAWIKNIREALDKNQFVLLAQPVLDLKANNITQHELLLRMAGEAGTLVAPDSFLEVAVKFNLIQEIDRWVLRQAVGLLREQARSGRTTLLSINFSAKAFVDSELLALLEKELSRISPASLMVEVSEMAALAEFHHAQKFIGALKSLGCRCALDDFGVGLTSFQHLKHLPLDFLKIDGSLIRGLADNPVNQHIVQAIGHMTRSLGVQTIAQGVDGRDTIQLLGEYGIGFAQGFAVGEPTPLKAIF